MRELVSGGSDFEKRWGYSRAVIDGDFVFVAGTTGFDYATMSISSDPVEQARVAFANVKAALERAGSRLEDVVRARYYVTDRAHWPAIGAVCGEVFGDVRPAATAVVCGLVDERMLIEIEVTAKRRPA